MSDIIPNLEDMTDAEKKAALDAIQLSIAKSKEVQKQRIGENVNLVIDALKKIEADIQSRYDEVGNTLEKRVASIKDGKDGKDGKNGKDGRDGKAGRDGVKGDKGDKGADGRDGVDGVDGVSVTDAKIDFDGSLVITLSTGQEINVGEVVPTDIAEKIKVFTTNGSSAGGSALIIKDENTVLTSAASSINFAGAGVTATTSGNDVTVTVSTGSGSVTSVAATAGTGISITGSPITTSGTLNITNTLPDQTVVLTASTGISTSGTYPNFTITNSAPDQTVALTGAGSTTISGTYPNFTITSSGDVVGPASSTDNAITRFDGTTGKLVQNSLVTVADDGAITAPQVGSIIPFYFANQAAFPSASTYHGAIAHSHADGAMYFAHGGVWTRILNDSGPLGTPSSGTLTNCTFPTLNQNTTGSAATLTTGRTIAITGDLAYTSPSFDGSGNVTAAGTLATVNSNVGSFTNASVTVNAKGLITAVSTGTGGAAVSNDTTTASNLFPLFASATTGTPSTIFTSNAKYLYKPSTGELKVDVPVAGNGIMVNSTTVATSYTIASGTNGFSVGPITINSGQAVTVSSGQRWYVI